MKNLLIIISTFLSINSAISSTPIDTAYIDSTGTIHIRITSIKDSIAIERFINNSWRKDTVIVSDLDKEIIYNPNYHSGINRFRLRGIITNYAYQDTLEFINVLPHVHMPIFCGGDSYKIYKKTEYKLMDSNGIIIKNGISDTVDLSDLKKGVYYLEHDNKLEKIYKK